MQTHAKPVVQQDQDPMPMVLRIIAYIDEDPKLYRQHIYSLSDQLIEQYPTKVVLASFAAEARNYTEACCALEATTDNLSSHYIGNTQIDALTSGLVQNKEAAWKKYNAVRLQCLSARRFQTRPLSQPSPPTNW